MTAHLSPTTDDSVAVLAMLNALVGKACMEEPSLLYHFNLHATAQEQHAVMQLRDTRVNAAKNLRAKITDTDRHPHLAVIFKSFIQEDDLMIATYLRNTPDRIDTLSESFRKAFAPYHDNIDAYRHTLGALGAGHIKSLLPHPR